MLLKWVSRISDAGRSSRRAKRSAGERLLRRSRKVDLVRSRRSRSTSRDESRGLAARIVYLWPLDAPCVAGTDVGPPNHRRRPVAAAKCR